MPDVIFIENPAPLALGPFLSGDSMAPIPGGSPLVIDGPFHGAFRPPEGSTGVVLVLQGAGGNGADGAGTTATGGMGGGGGAKGTLTIPDGLWASGGYLLLDVGIAHVNTGLREPFTRVRDKTASAYYDAARGTDGNGGGGGGAWSTSGAPAFAVPSDTGAGAAGSAAAGAAGGAGGNAATGAAGGAGGVALGANGKAGAKPGAGGGGGAAGGKGGAGAPGRITITWVSPP